MINIEKIKELNPYIKGYCKIVIEGAQERFSYLSETKENLVVGTLIARMATLSAHLMACPMGWNYYMAALSFRSQVECLITLSWMLQDINENSKRYIVTSIRQDEKNAEKYDEYLSDLVKEYPEFESDASFVQSRKETKEREHEKEKWRKCQRAKWGDDKGMPDIATRAKTLEKVLEATYIDMYKWLCEHSHNSWCLLYECNTKEILNSTLRYPIISDGIDMRIMEKSAGYLNIAYQKIDRYYDLKIDVKLPEKYWEEKESEIKGILDATEL